MCRKRKNEEKSGSFTFSCLGELRKDKHASMKSDTATTVANKNTFVAKTRKQEESAKI